MSIKISKTPAELDSNVDHLVTEDETPVDNWYCEKQQRLFTEPLYSSWRGPGNSRPFVAAANVGLYHAAEEPPLVPDGMLSVDVKVPDDLWPKGNRCYFIWKMGKEPDVVIEAVSNTEGGELGDKMETYAAWQIKYYVVWDPETIISAMPLQGFELRRKKYRSLTKLWFPEVSLGLCIWHGIFEAKETQWLRWCDEDGTVILTGKERADLQQLKAEKEHERAERLAVQLRGLGVQVPDNGNGGKIEP